MEAKLDDWNAVARVRHLKHNITWGINMSRWNATAADLESVLCGAGAPMRPGAGFPVVHSETTRLRSSEAVILYCTCGKCLGEQNKRKERSQSPFPA